MVNCSFHTLLNLISYYFVFRSEINILFIFLNKEKLDLFKEKGLGEGDVQREGLHSIEFKGRGSMLAGKVYVGQ